VYTCIGTDSHYLVFMSSMLDGLVAEFAVVVMWCCISCTWHLLASPVYISLFFVSSVDQCSICNA